MIELFVKKTWDSLSMQRQKVRCSNSGNTDTKPRSPTPGVQAMLGGLFNHDWRTHGNIWEAW
ncbi:uncharacterized protein LACBIDRAFT_317842 [Laccaria bicolor S238N-H82]|uniref:Predicted protein n=1 Tax=Laccaria bicolor (strain S238N-H82 / ATCC MYA-4686) TaxID=486041 RepID=B0D5D1_LACBS|nr:uncharacterized protein LACBIDRAFT_317842 [Laccaria bicolor S238N-H82]EDR09752.1 predicted protein [Laccaria bicolor S238N-H82]|eukprot:XP_001879137.1 predicted protein [Laccaria bicolor S238N-H82]